MDPKLTEELNEIKICPWKKDLKTKESSGRAEHKERRTQGTGQNREKIESAKRRVEANVVKNERVRKI